jgi:hypothetical protein
MMKPAPALLTVITTTLLGFATSSPESDSNINNNNNVEPPASAILDDFVCEHPPYKIHLVSSSPLVVYIEDFLTLNERRHLKAAR